MTLTYKLEQNDYLQNQLYLASKTPRIKRQRTRSWLIVFGSSFLLSFMFYQSGNKALFYYFLILGLLALFFYPFYQRSYYKKHYKRFVADIYKNRFGRIVKVTFTDNTIEQITDAGETKINLSELESISETGEYFFPKLKSGGALIILKNKEVDVNEFRNELKLLCGKLNIPFIEDLNWTWK